MPQGAGGTQGADQPVIMQLNNKAVRTTADLQAAFDSLEPGATVAITFQAKGKNLAIEGVVKQR